LVLAVPLGVWAQSLEPAFESLTVSLWAEFDRPEVLVIYRGQLDSDTELPARLTFTLPGYVQEIHAIAERQDGRLVNVNPELVESVYEGDDLLLTFTAESPEVQFEYYDSVILVRQDQTRAYSYTLTAPYAVEVAALEVQHPVQASDVAVVPEPSETRVGTDGLSYSSLEATDLEPGDMLEVSVSYQRSGNELSVDLLQAQAPSAQPSPDEPAASEPSTSNAIIYAVAGAGVILLLWVVWEVAVRPTFAQRSSPVPARRSTARRQEQRRRARRKESTARAGDAAADSVVRFCHKCGSSLREDADFCHRCGAERRSR
jgi:hypothetical protein